MSCTGIGEPSCRARNTARGGGAWSGLGDELRDTFRAAFKVGAGAWRESRRAAAANGADAAAANGSAAAAAAGMARFARRGHGKAKEWSTRWLNDANRVVMSSVVVPEGEQYTCTDNESSVSALSRVAARRCIG